VWRRLAAVCFVLISLCGGADAQNLRDFIRQFQGAVGQRIQPPMQPTQPDAAPSPPNASPEPIIYSVDGLVLATQVNFQSEAYKQYDCGQSDKFSGFIWCHKEKHERAQRGDILTANSILHSQDGTVVYINHYVEPAFFGANDVQNEIGRLSQRFKQTTRIFHWHSPSGSDSTIAVWGGVILEPLSDSDVATIAAGGSIPGLSISYLGDLEKSAKAGAPIYRIGGSAGYVWAATVSPAEGKGVLRFLAADMSKVNAPNIARSSSDKAIPDQPPSSITTNTDAPSNDCDTFAASFADQHRKGPGTPIDNLDLPSALPACEAAVKQYPDSDRLAFQLGRVYEKAKNDPAAVLQYTRAASHGYAEAQSNLGMMFESGRGVPRDFNQALLWLNQAHRNGSFVAAYNLGGMFIKGEGVRQDYEQAATLIKEAADRGLPQAQNTLGEIYEKVFHDYKQAATFYHAAAFQDFQPALANLRRLSPSDASQVEVLAKQTDELRKLSHQTDALSTQIRIAINDGYLPESGWPEANGLRTQIDELANQTFDARGDARTRIDELTDRYDKLNAALSLEKKRQAIISTSSSLISAFRDQDVIGMLNANARTLPDELSSEIDGLGKLSQTALSSREQYQDKIVSAESHIHQLESDRNQIVEVRTIQKKWKALNDHINQRGPSLLDGSASKERSDLSASLDQLKVAGLPIDSDQLESIRSRLDRLSSSVDQIMDAGELRREHRNEQILRGVSVAAIILTLALAVWVIVRGRKTMLKNRAETSSRRDPDNLSGPASPADERIANLAALVSKGVLSADEFETLKVSIVAEQKNKGSSDSSAVVEQQAKAATAAVTQKIQGSFAQIIGGIAAFCVVGGAIAWVFDNEFGPDLEVTQGTFCDNAGNPDCQIGGVLRILNKGSKPVTILGVMVNDKPQCAIKSNENLGMGNVTAITAFAVQAVQDSTRQMLQQMSRLTGKDMGDSGLPAPMNCGEIVKVSIRTDQGTADYFFK
jgi:tetratricopeptide (TPR) repeat protein